MQERSPSACALRLNPPSPEFRKLKSFFKNVLASFEHMKSRKGIIDIIPHAGHYKFKRYGLVLNVYPSLTDDQHYYCETHRDLADIIGITLQDSKERPLVAVSPTELCKILPMITFARRSDISWLINHVIGDGELY